MADHVPKAMFPIAQRSVDRFRQSYREDESGCWLWTRNRYAATGYGRFTITTDRSRQFLAHRVSWVVAHGMEIPKGAIVRHSCDVRACVNPEHLKLGSKRDNTQDMVLRGRARNGTTKLTADQVHAIRTIKQMGYSNAYVGKIFRVSKGHISEINNRLKWADLA